MQLQHEFDPCVAWKIPRGKAQQIFPDSLENPHGQRTGVYSPLKVTQTQTQLKGLAHLPPELSPISRLEPWGGYSCPAQEGSQSA